MAGDWVLHIGVAATLPCAPKSITLYTNYVSHVLFVAAAALAARKPAALVPQGSRD